MTTAIYATITILGLTSSVVLFVGQWRRMGL